MKFKVGQIVFFNNKTFYAKIIILFNYMQYGEKGWAHNGIITKVNRESVIIQEAVSKGFIENVYSKKYLISRMIKKTVDIKETKKRLVFVHKNAKRYEGRPYGYLDIISLMFSLVLGKWSIGLTGAKQLICSEAVARVLYDSSIKKINFSKEYDKPYDLITPQDMYISKELKSVPHYAKR